jgi:hypothetical protein
MDEDESLRATNLQVEEPSKPNPYQLLMRQSRKMGGLATRTYDVTKEFLKADVTQIHPDNIIFRKKAGNRESQSIANIVKKSHEVLAAAQTVMLPRNIFPDSVLLDRSKLTIKKRSFFWSSETITIRIEDILNVSSTIGPFFGSITVSSRVMNSTDHYEIDCFLRKDAIYLKEMIQGYMIALHSKVNTGHLKREELINTLVALGRDSEM